MNLVLTAEEIEKNWEIFNSYLEKYISEPRKRILQNFYNSLEERIMFMPASIIEHHHNCFPGGYIDHVNRVCKFALEIGQMYITNGANDSFTKEEIIMAAMHHDLGKIGDLNNECYLPQTDNWRQNNLGEMYIYNPDVDFMTVPDRSLFLLQEIGVKLTRNEFIAIKTHDGLYDEANKPYYISYNPKSKPSHSLNYIIHQADLMAARIEYEMYFLNKNKIASDIKPDKKEPKVVKTLKNTKSKNLLDLIEDI